MSEAEDAKSTAVEDIKGDNDTTNSKIGISRCSCRSNCLQDNDTTNPEITIGIVSIVLGFGVLGISYFIDKIYHLSFGIFTVERLEPIVGRDWSLTVAFGTLGIPSLIIYITLCRLVLKIKLKESIPKGILGGLAFVAVYFIAFIIYLFTTPLPI